MIDPEQLVTLTKEQVERKREELGLNKPLPVRYAIWLGQVLRGNLGYSYITHLPVLRTFSFAWSDNGAGGGRADQRHDWGVLMGVVSALRQYGIVDYVLSTVALIGVSTPTFFFALIALLVFSLYIPIFPAFGLNSGTGPFNLFDNLWHLALPATSAVTGHDGRGAASGARSDAGGAARGLCDHSTGQRAWGASGHREALLPQRAAPDHNDDDLAPAGSVRRRVHSRVHVRLAGDGFAHPRLNQVSGLPTDHGPNVDDSHAGLLANLLADILYAWADPRVRLTN